jgi:hypothetical protein
MKHFGCHARPSVLFRAHRDARAIPVFLMYAFLRGASFNAHTGAYGEDRKAVTYPEFMISVWDTPAHPPVASKLSRPRAAVSASAAVAPKAEAESFGQRIAYAVKVRLAQRSRRPVFAESSAPDESFAEQLRKAAEKRSRQKQHKEWAERERYEQQAERAKGE